MKAPLPPDEAGRLDALQQYQVLDTLPEHEFDDLTHLAAYICGTPVAILGFIDRERQWFKSSVGWSGSEAPREFSLCAHAILEQDLVVVPDVAADARFADNPGVRGEPPVRFYAGVPLITPSGHGIGTLCVVDVAPRQLSPEQQDALRRLARQAVAHLEARSAAPPQVSSGQDLAPRQSRQERLHAQEFLLQSEARYRSLFESAQDGILILNARSGRIEDANPSLCELLGCDAKYLQGKPLWEINAFKSVAASREEWDALQEAGQEAGAFCDDLSLEASNGQVISVDLVASAYEVGDKKVVQCHIRDISERKRAEAALSESEARFRFLTDLGDATRALSEPREIMATVARLLGQHLRASRCAYAEVEAGGEDFTIRGDYTDGCASTVGRYQLSLFGPRACAELRANETLVVHDVDEELAPDEGAAMFNAIGIKAIICCPLLRNGELRSMMAVHQTTPRRWSDSEISLIQEVVERCWAIIERARAELVLRESKQRLDFVIEVAELGEWDMNLLDQTAHRSPRHDLIFGYQTPLPEWTYEMFLDHVLPEERAQVDAKFQAALKQDTTWDFEANIRRADGETACIWARGRIWRGEDGNPTRMLGTVTDISQSKHDARSLLERTRLAELNADVGQALIRDDSLPEMLRLCAEVMVEHLDAAFARIWILEQAGTFLELKASAGLYTHLDGPHGRVPVGQFKIGLIAQERQPHLTNQVLDDPRVSDQEWARREGMVSFAGYPLVVEDRLIGVTALFARKPLNEATLQSLASVANAIVLGIERKRGEEERLLLLQSEQSARQEAEATNRIKDEFLATLSHELRTPLNAILGWAHMLRVGQLQEEEASRALETIERNARSQVQLIEDLLDVSRIISGKLRLEVRPIELSEVIQNAVDAVRPSAEAKSIRLQVLVDPQAGPVSGDASRLQQVVWNLLSNAVKFTPKGGRVQVRLERVNSHLEISISDSGQGIAPDFLPHIFDRFRQAEQSSTRSHGGLGLGLSIVHQLVELHGGTVQADSLGLGQGSTFVVQLPCMAARPAPSEQAERRHPTAGGVVSRIAALDCPPELDGLRVLIVDDEADTRNLLRAVLERCGSQVRTESTVATALEVFCSWQPEVLVSDIGMPGEDGYSLIAKVRAWEAQHGGRVPAIALTAYARVEDRVQALRAGFHVHVPKPIEPVELLAFVASLAGRT